MSLLMRDLLTMAENQMREAGVPDLEYDARALMEYAFAMDRADLFMRWSSEAEEYHVDTYLDMVGRRCDGEPLQYITGSQCFMGIDFEVNEDVLIPRQDTEVVVEQAKLLIDSTRNRKTVDKESTHIYEAIQGRKNWKVLDLCCGSGAIGISLAKLCGNTKKVIGTDISADAVVVARRNMERAGVDKKMDLHVGDLYGALGRREKFDMIISNPPYIRSDVIPTLMREVKDHEPMLALDGGADGLDFYRNIIAGAAARLEKDGVLVLEIGHDQGEAIREMLGAFTYFTRIEIVKDYAGNDRVAIAAMEK